MNVELENRTDALAQAIRESEEYQRYTAIRDKVAKMPELRSQINAFRSHNFYIQNSPEILDMYEELDRMSREYQEFRKDPVVDEYLRCELSVCRMIQRIAMTLIGSVDLDLDEVAENLPF